MGWARQFESHLEIGGVGGPELFERIEGGRGHEVVEVQPIGRGPVDVDHPSGLP